MTAIRRALGCLGWLRMHQMQAPPARGVVKCELRYMRTLDADAGCCEVRPAGALRIAAGVHANRVFGRGVLQVLGGVLGACYRT